MQKSMQNGEEHALSKILERLGEFYLGREVDPRSGETTQVPLLYDAADLTTHAVCVGMTGSGKTGLGIALLEDALLDGVPSIVIDPKGDMGNLLLNFPGMRAEDFLPWLDSSEGAGANRQKSAEITAATWREGLQSWGQGLDRVAALARAGEMRIYTPGSQAGRMLSFLGTMAPPSEELNLDQRTEKLSAVVSALLSLLGMEADPLQDREHILISNIVNHYWNEGRGVGFADLIAAIQTPPFERLGVFELNTFYPARDRLALAMRLNALLAAPGFEAWLTGEPLDVANLLRSPDGRPRLSIISIAHLGDAQRMFVVTRILNEVVAWMRAQPGTSSLRALLYMDEVFGFCPPTANPPSKSLMLTLLKQARAFGLGCVLATQNPVDLDYKGLGNAGTWFVGRLQTERDKARLLDGLESVGVSGGSGWSRSELDDMISSLGKRVFLMNNTHEDHPVLFQTRWVMSYLRGPLTRRQISQLTATQTSSPAADDAASTGPLIPPTGRGQDATQQKKPILPSRIDECFLLPARAGANPRLFMPGLLAQVQLHYVDTRSKIDVWKEVTWLNPNPCEEGPMNWDEAVRPDMDFVTVQEEVPASGSFGDLDGAFSDSRAYARWKRELISYLYQHAALETYACPDLKLHAGQFESLAAFQDRVALVMREQRDEQVLEAKAEYAKKADVLRRKIDRAEQRLAREQSQYDAQKMDTMVSFGSTLLGAFLGRKTGRSRGLTRAARAARGLGRAARERGDVGRASESVETLMQELATMDEAFEGAMFDLLLPPTLPEISTRKIAPRKRDIEVSRLALAWVPHETDANGRPIMLLKAQD